MYLLGTATGLHHFSPLKKDQLVASLLLLVNQVGYKPQIKVMNWAVCF